MGAWPALDRSSNTAEGGCATRAWKILKRCFQNRLFSEVGLVKMSYFPPLFLLNFLDWGMRFADNSYQLVTLQIWWAIVGFTGTAGFGSYLVGSYKVGHRGAASAGRPGKACNPVDCGLPFGSQLPRPLMGWSVFDKDAFQSSTSPPPLDEVAGVCEKTALGF